MSCALPPLCSHCQGKKFVYLPEWRHCFARTSSLPADPNEPFTTDQVAGTVRMVAATKRAATSVWAVPTQENLPISLRICATCGATQPYVGAQWLRRLLEGASSDEATYVDHEAQAPAPYR